MGMLRHTLPNVPWPPIASMMQRWPRSPRGPKTIGEHDCQPRVRGVWRGLIRGSDPNDAINARNINGVWRSERNWVPTFSA
jgi:hypothetical protein